MKLRSNKIWIGTGLKVLVAGGLAACGSTSSNSRNGSATPSAAIAGDATRGQVLSDGTQVSVPTNPTAYACGREKTPAEFMTTLVEDLFRRSPNQTELNMAQDPAFDPGKAVDWALAQQDFVDNGIPYFVSNLLRINENLQTTATANTAAGAAQVALVADLQQEPVILVQRNLDKPWGDMFTTQDYYCTARTGPLYNYPVDASVSGFVSCPVGKTQPQRAGLQGLVSFLRAYPSAMWDLKNNYPRNRILVYLAQGLELAAKTGGPTGTGRPQPLPACVPGMDTRVSDTGLVFGSAAVPQSGPICASCHVPYHAEMVGAFLQFDIDGSLMQLGTIDQLQANQRDFGGVSTDLLKDILTNSGSSCWSASGQADTPQAYQGQPGIGRLIAASPLLGKALGIQIQTNLANTDPVDAATAAVQMSFDANGKTLLAGMKGYFNSDVYRCSVKASP